MGFDIKTSDCSLLLHLDEVNWNFNIGFKGTKMSNEALLILIELELNCLVCLIKLRTRNTYVHCCYKIKFISARSKTKDLPVNWVDNGLIIRAYA